MLATIAARDSAVATSGDYERYFMRDGVRYHEILDPSTGFPARKSRGVTVVHEELIWADALATAIFVMGPEKGIVLVEEMNGVEALIIDAKGEVTVSSGMKDRITFR